MYIVFLGEYKIILLYIGHCPYQITHCIPYKLTKKSCDRERERERERERVAGTERERKRVAGTEKEGAGSEREREWQGQRERRAFASQAVITYISCIHAC